MQSTHTHTKYTKYDTQNTCTPKTHTTHTVHSTPARAHTHTHTHVHTQIHSPYRARGLMTPRLAPAPARLMRWTTTRACSRRCSSCGGCPPQSRASAATDGGRQASMLCHAESQRALVCRRVCVSCMLKGAAAGPGMGAVSWMRTCSGLHLFVRLGGTHVCGCCATKLGGGGASATRGKMGRRAQGLGTEHERAWLRPHAHLLTWVPVCGMRAPHRVP